MKQIIEAYGGLLFDVAVLGLLLVLVFTQIEDDAGNKGVLAMTGAQLDVESPDYENYQDFDIYQTESGKDAPVIICNGAAALQTGVIRLADHITATDYEGNILDFTVESITDTDGTELIGGYDSSTTEIAIDTAGIYTLTLYAVDDINKRTECRITLPVNGWG